DAFGDAHHRLRRGEDAAVPATVLPHRLVELHHGAQGRRPLRLPRTRRFSQEISHPLLQCRNPQGRPGPAGIHARGVGGLKAGNGEWGIVKSRPSLLFHSLFPIPYSLFPATKTSSTAPSAAAPAARWRAGRAAARAGTTAARCGSCPAPAPR